MVNGDYSYFSCLYIISDVVLTNKYFNIRFIVNGSIKGTVKAKLVAGAYKKNRYYFSDEDKNYYHHDTHTGAEDSLFNNILRNSSVVNKTVNAYIWFTNS